MGLREELCPVAAVIHTKVWLLCGNEDSWDVFTLHHWTQLSNLPLALKVKKPVASCSFSVLAIWLALTLRRCWPPLTVGKCLFVLRCSCSVIHYSFQKSLENLPCDVHGFLHRKDCKLFIIPLIRVRLAGLSVGFWMSFDNLCLSRTMFIQFKTLKSVHSISLSSCWCLLDLELCLLFYAH